jgi:aspartyl-tRNA(Asn)/glutamyl-tRNA(Gln) amidotransferase subunit A
MNYNSLKEVQTALQLKKHTLKALTQQYLDNIEQQKHLNAFIEVYKEEALAKADAIDAKLMAGTAGRLAGMVIGIKDVLCYEGHTLTASSKILSGFKSQFTGTAVQRLLDEDAIIIGRQSCDEFAMGSSNENSVYGPVLNAMDNTKVPGGSSGGSAVAVQANMCLASIGSDTGGSVRQPAAFCGVVGLKPTYGRISRYGLIAYGSSFDCIGPITKSVDDAALLLEVMSGRDDFDSTSSSKPVPQFSNLLSEEKALRIGYFNKGLDASIQPEVKAAFEDSIAELKAKGHQLAGFDFPLIDYMLPTYYILTMAEASSNLSRYDGVRYGYRSENATNLESMYKKTRSEAFGKEVKKRILLGTFVLSANYYDAYFTKAQRVRRLLRNATEQLFEQFDLLIMPASPTTAFKIGEKSTDSLQMYLADIFTVHANLTGNPCIAIPAGHDAVGMPIGLQIMAKRFDEVTMLQLAKSLEHLAV